MANVYLPFKTIMEKRSPTNNTAELLFPTLKIPQPLLNVNGMVKLSSIQPEAIASFSPFPPSASLSARRGQVRTPVLSINNHKRATALGAELITEAF
jgi:hypothetical protein